MCANSADGYDVAILGTGFEGSVLGTILARYGYKVLMIDSGTHPWFALGESTVRHTFTMMKIIGRRFQMPELMEKFSSATRIHKYVTSACGEKSNFGFVYHREGQHQTPEEARLLLQLKDHARCSRPGAAWWMRRMADSPQLRQKQK